MQMGTSAGAWLVSALFFVGCAGATTSDFDPLSIDDDGLLTPENAWVNPGTSTFWPFEQTGIDPTDVFGPEDQEPTVVPGESFVCPFGSWYASVNKESSIENRCIFSLEDGELPQTETLEPDCDIDTDSRIGFGWAPGTAPVGYRCPKDFTLVDDKACYRTIPTVPDGVRNFCGALAIFQYLGFAWDTPS